LIVWSDEDDCGSVFCFCGRGWSVGVFRSEAFFLGLGKFFSWGCFLLVLLFPLCSLSVVYGLVFVGLFLSYLLGQCMGCVFLGLVEFFVFVKRGSGWCWSYFLAWGSSEKSFLFFDSVRLFLEAGRLVVWFLGFCF